MVNLNECFHGKLKPFSVKTLIIHGTSVHNITLFLICGDLFQILVCTPVIKKGLEDDTETVYYLIGRILLSAKISPCKDDDLPLKTKWEKNVGSQGIGPARIFWICGF